MGREGSDQGGRGMAVMCVQRTVGSGEVCVFFFFFQAEDGIRVLTVTGVQTCALPICASRGGSIFSRTFRGVFGGSLKHEVPLVVSYSQGAVAAVTAKVRAEVNRAPRDRKSVV